MKNKNTVEEHFRTSSFYTAAFLFAKGIELINIDRTLDSKRSYFVFLNSSECKLLVHAFDFAKESSLDILIDARKLIFAIKTLKEKLYQNNL